MFFLECITWLDVSLLCLVTSHSHTATQRRDESAMGYTLCVLGKLSWPVFGTLR